MTDDFDTRVETWLRDRAQPDPASLEAVRGSIDALPPRRRRPQRAWLAGAAAVIAVVAIGASSLLLSPQRNGTAPTPPTTPSRPVPPDPAAFAGDPRLNACYGEAGPVEFAFEMPHARDYQRHFPAMLLAPELDVDDPAFAVVFASDSPALIGGSRPPSATVDPNESSNPNERWVCILVGGTPNVYENVDISGMRVDLGDATSSQAPATPPPVDAIDPFWTPPPLPASTTGMPVSPDPAAFASDPRFRACASSAGAALYAFELTRARDLLDVVPGFTGREPELDSDAAAFVVILRDPVFRRFGHAPPRGQTPEATPTYRADQRDICVLTGPVVSGSIGTYGQVSISGFDPDRVTAPAGPPYHAPDALLPVYPGIAWTSADGTPLSPNVITAYQAPCGMVGASYLQIGWPQGATATLDTMRRYIRNPPDWSDAEAKSYEMRDSFDESASLPAKATFSGYRTAEFELWTSPDTVDSSVFIKWADHVERWPRVGTWSCSPA